MSDYRTLLVPYDFSEHAKAALDTAIELARRLDADLHLLRVVQTPFHPRSQGGPRPTAPEGIREGVMLSLREVASSLRSVPRPVAAHVVEGANVVASIREAALEIGADLIVMGTQGRTNLSRALLGNVAARTLRSAPCPVLTVRAPESASDANLFSPCGGAQAPASRWARSALRRRDACDAASPRASAARQGTD
jgi:nucleotide-binding universal stress UspA family protein